MGNVESSSSSSSHSSHIGGCRIAKLSNSVTASTLLRPAEQQQQQVQAASASTIDLVLPMVVVHANWSVQESCVLTHTLQKQAQALLLSGSTLLPLCEPEYYIVFTIYMLYVWYMYSTGLPFLRLCQHDTICLSQLLLF